VTATELRDLVIGFLYVGNVSPIPEIMVASVRAAMPGARIVQMTDHDTRKVIGADDVIRKAWDRKFLMTYRLLHLKEFPAADAIFLDADIVVQKDLRPLFRDEFDVALTYRDETDPSLRKSPEAYQMMPFNAGVMLSRPSGRDFWAETHRVCLEMPEARQQWFGDQLAIKEVAARTTLKVKQYPCAFYNYSPARWDEDLSEKFVIHYKGENRKMWMLEQWKHLLRQGR
jgi:lipopolysaccharide biosynthesis glycosyltransferase